MNQDKLGGNGVQIGQNIRKNDSLSQRHDQVPNTDHTQAMMRKAALITPSDRIVVERIFFLYMPPWGDI